MVVVLGRVRDRVASVISSLCPVKSPTSYNSMPRVAKASYQNVEIGGVVVVARSLMLHW